MSDDLIERLREAVKIAEFFAGKAMSPANAEYYIGIAKLMIEAAAEIERLRVALERADILIRRAGLSQNGDYWEAVMQYETARAALENTP